MIQGLCCTRKEKLLFGRDGGGRKKWWRNDANSNDFFISSGPKNLGQQNSLRTAMADGNASESDLERKSGRGLRTSQSARGKLSWCKVGGVTGPSTPVSSLSLSGNEARMTRSDLCGVQKLWVWSARAKGRWGEEGVVRE